MHLFDKLKQIEACIFDLDGTLLDSLSIWNEVDRQYLESYNIEYDSTISEELMSLSFQETAQYFKDTFQIPRTTNQIMDDFHAIVEVQYREHIELKEGVREILHYLKSEGVKMCIATSCHKEHALTALRRLQIDTYFSFVLTSQEVKKNKNYPDIYMECANKLEVKIENTMVFEDLLVALQVAKKAGFQTCGVHDISSNQDHEEFMKVSDYFIYSFISNN